MRLNRPQESLSVFDEQRQKKISIEELAGVILKMLQRKVRPLGNNFWDGDVHEIHEVKDSLTTHFDQGAFRQVQILPEFEETCVEAWDLLQRRGLIRQVDQQRQGFMQLTRNGREADADALFASPLPDSGQAAVEALRSEIPNLDDVVAAYYAESIDAVKEGLTLGGAFLLGVASERAIRLCVKAIRDAKPEFQSQFDNALCGQSFTRVLELFNDRQVRRFVEGYVREIPGTIISLGENYRRLRNDSGHPKDVIPNIDSKTLRSYIEAFKKYAVDIFQLIQQLNTL